MDTMLRELTDPRTASGYGGCFYGLYPALVSDVVDPDGQGRVRVRLPWSPDAAGDGAYEAWARLATMMAGAERGSFFVPDVGDEVLVGFEAGDPRRPYVVGALWNGQDAPPESMDAAGRNDVKSLTSRSGVKITLEDTPGGEKLVLETPGGQTVTLSDVPPGVEIRDASGNSVAFGPSGISLETPGRLTVQASAVEITSPLNKIDGAMTQISGVVQSDVVITQSVVSTSYSPGAGNIL